MGPANSADLRQRVSAYVQQHMSAGSFDASHDWSHIQRVLNSSLAILNVESKRENAPVYNQDLVYLAALMHDVVDHKYIDPKNAASLENKIYSVLQDFGAEHDLAVAAQTVCKNVSYSHEMKHPDEVQYVLKQHPELAVVQDADRLDAIGATGIARVFAYTGAASSRGKPRTLEGTIDHFDEKLERIEGYMKTDEGRRLARERTARLQQFRRWMAEEIECKDYHTG